MRKTTVWWLISILVVLFFALIGVEISYMRSLVNIHTHDFDEAVHKSLGRVSFMLESDEAERYLNIELEERERNMLESQDSTRRLRPGPELEQVMGSEELKEKFLRQKNLINDVVLRLMHRASIKPLEQRIDFAQLQYDLDSELEMQGLSGIPYHYVLEDKNGFVVYISENFEAYYDGFDQFQYRQDLFMNDPGTRFASLCVWFPTRDQYRHVSMGIFVPIIFFSLCLMAMTIVLVINFLRQKSYADMKSDFISNMTHELKTPVSSISLASQMLSDKDVAKSPAVTAHLTSVIIDESKRLSMLIEKVLQLSMFSQNDNKAINLKPVDMNKVIDAVVQIFRLKVQQAGGDISTELKADRYMVMADGVHISNVLFNLLDNALKYRSYDRALNLKLASENIGDKAIRIMVSDNGIGIARDDLRHIFERFYRVQKGNVHNVKGFGLGLSYVQMIVHKHQGEITVESEKGKGTTFYIILPLIKNN